MYFSLAQSLGPLKNFQHHTVRASHRRTTHKSFAIPPTTLLFVNYRTFYQSDIKSSVDSTPTFSTFFFSCSLPLFLPNHYLPLPRLPTGGGTLVCQQFLNEVIRRWHDDTLRTKRLGSGGRLGRLQVATRLSGRRRKRSCSFTIESECSVIFLIYHATNDHPPLPTVGHLHVWCWLQEVFPAGHMFMDKKQEREGSVHVFDIEGDSLAVVLIQKTPSGAITIIVHKDVLLGLFSINEQHEESGAERE